MLGALSLRNKIKFLTLAVLFNCALLFFISWAHQNYELRHYSSDEFYQLGAEDYR
jgi:hypothetical protein